MTALPDDPQGWVHDQRARTERGEDDPDLGWQFFLRSHGGAAPDSHTLRVTCGLITGVPALVNSVVVRADTSDAAAVLRPVESEVVRALAHIWWPDWAVATDQEFRARVKGVLAQPRLLLPGRVT